MGSATTQVILSMAKPTDGQLCDVSQSKKRPEVRNITSYIGQNLGVLDTNVMDKKIMAKLQLLSI